MLRPGTRWIRTAMVMFSVAVVTALLAPGLSGPSPAGAASLRPVAFSVDFIIDGRYAPWYVALDKGFYRGEGLDVTITPGNGSQGVLQRLASGINQFVFADMGGLVLAAGNSAVDDRMVAVMYAQAPYAIFSLKREDLTTLAALQGKQIATNAGSPVSDLFRIVVQDHHLDPSTFHWIKVDPSTKTQLLVAGKVDAAENYIMSKPIFERATAAEGGVNALLLADQGLHIYSNGIVATNAYLKRHPEVARAFVKASVEGFRYAFAHPDDAARIMLRRFPTLNPAVIVEQIAILRQISSGPGTAQHGLGYLDPGRVASTVHTITQAFHLTAAPAPSALYSDGYLPARP